MKTPKIAIISVILLLTLFQSYPHSMLIDNIADDNNPQATIVDKVYKSKDQYLEIDVTIPQIENLANKEGEKIINDEITKWTEAWINDVELIVDQYFKDGVAPSFPYQLNSKYTITSTENPISFYIDYYQFTGGAHGMTTRIAYNIDKTKGTKLNLKDLFNNNYDYKGIIDKEINKQIKKDPDKYFTGKEGFNGIKDNQDFYIREDTVVIYFGLYEIAPYVAGIIEFNIPVKLFKGNYIY